MNSIDIRRGEGSLPDAMQGHWVDTEDAGSDLVIDGFDVVYQGLPVRHDYIRIAHIDHALCVSLKIDSADDSAIQDFTRESLTELVIDPEGTFHAYNVKFGASFERAAA